MNYLNNQLNQLHDQVDDLEKEKVGYAQKEQELKREVVAWRELLTTKDEEIKIIDHKYESLKRQRPALQQSNPGNNKSMRKDNIVLEENGKSATCSSNDCVIF